ncbi:MAG: hypothetical protein ACKESB_02140 [Candidatus Hodgkinia cicadicola]
MCGCIAAAERLDVQGFRKRFVVMKTTTCCYTLSRGTRAAAAYPQIAFF